MKLLRPLFLLAWLTATAAWAGPRAFVVDRAFSQIEVAVKATVDSFVAKLPVYDAAVTVEADAPRVTAAVLRFDFRDLKTGKPARDEQMHAWQQTDRFPDGAFTLAVLEPAAEGRFTARGRLRLHGVERDLAFPVSITADQTVFSVDGEAKIDTREYGLPVIRKFALLKVDPIVTVRFHLQGAIASR